MREAGDTDLGTELGTELRGASHQQQQQQQERAGGAGLHLSGPDLSAWEGATLSASSRQSPADARCVQPAGAGSRECSPERRGGGEGGRCFVRARGLGASGHQCPGSGRGWEAPARPGVGGAARPGMHLERAQPGPRGGATPGQGRRVSPGIPENLADRSAHEPARGLLTGPFQAEDTEPIRPSSKCQSVTPT